MLAEVAGFAILATISPAALTVMTVFLASASPRRAALMYVTGALVMTVVMAVAVLLAIRVSGLNLQREYYPRYGLRLALGIVALAVGAVIGSRMPRGSWTFRGPGEPRQVKPGSGLISRLANRPTARTAFVAGLICFVPSATFIAAVQVIATANADIAFTALGLAIVVVLTAMIAWLPMLAYLAAPDATARRLRAANGWLRVHGKALTVVALAICGIALVINGALGLANRRLG
jgi:threonine/homoserine/homoserine lactone efflux protein